MTIQLTASSRSSLQEIIEMAAQKKISMKVIDDEFMSISLPGEPLSNEELSAFLESSKNSGRGTLDELEKKIRSRHENSNHE